MHSDPENRDEKLRAIKDEILTLTQSPLYAYRTENKYFPVIGQGDHYARIMFIGEAPGKMRRKAASLFAEQQDAFWISYYSL